MPVKTVTDLGGNVGKVECLVHCLLRNLGVGGGHPTVLTLALLTKDEGAKPTYALGHNRFGSLKFYQLEFAFTRMGYQSYNRKALL